jgi:tetratricopeptide (TPR) repeat protein
MEDKSRKGRQENINLKKSPVKVQSKTIGEKPVFFENPLFLAIAILALTFIAFLPSLKNDFISTWDDDQFVTVNLLIRQLSFSSIKAMFSTPVIGAYVPIPLLSFAIEYHFFGLDPLPYHISNLLLHLGCTILVFYFFRLLKFNNLYSALGALVFGIHPMHVESVAWITERKDLLYGLFYLCSMIFYILYIQKQKRRWRLISLSILFFILSLFSKIQAVVLPVSLLLIDYYLKRPFTFRLVFEKIPFFILSLLFGIAGVFILRKLGAIQIGQNYSFFQRIFFGLYALGSYFFKFFASVHLSAFYPVPASPKQSWMLYFINPAFLLLIAILVYISARHTRAIVFGILFFFFNVLFLLQIVGAGTTYLSDHYSYISYIGLLFIFAWGIREIVNKKKINRTILISALSIILIFFMTLTFNRCKIWANGLTLWTDVIEKYPGEAPIAYYNRGVEYFKIKQPDKALDDYTSAIGIYPKYQEAYYDRAVVYTTLGQWDKAIADYSMTIEINPAYDSAYSNRGVLYAYLGQWDNAINDCSTAIRINPNCESAYSNRGNVYGNLKQWDKAIADYTSAIDIDPNYKEAYYNRSNAYAHLGQWDKGIADCSRALEIDPGYKEACYNLGLAYGNLGQNDMAIANFTRAIGIDMNYAEAYFGRGLAYGNLGEWEKAIEDYNKVLEINPNFTLALNSREVAYKNLRSR